MARYAAAVVAAVLLLALLSACGQAATQDEGHGHRHGHGHHGNHQQQQGCVECSQCRHHDHGCYNNCKKSCDQQVKPQGIDIEACKRYGTDAGNKAAQQACDTTMLYCRGGQRSFGAQPQRNKVSLEQCGNAAYGVCQNRAMDPKASPCGSSFNGVQQCKKEDFQKFYTGEVDYWCNQGVAAFDKKN